MDPVIFHITSRSMWGAACSLGRYEPPSLGRYEPPSPGGYEPPSPGGYEPPSLSGEGFIHFSKLDQLVAVANARFAGEPDLVLLCTAVDRLTATLKYENTEGGEELFPHLYGPLNLDAVVAVVPLIEGENGFQIPPEVRALVP